MSRMFKVTFKHFCWRLMS